MSKKTTVALVRKAEQKKVLPYSVLHFDSNEDAKAWKKQFNIASEEALSKSIELKKLKAVGKFLEDHRPLYCAIPYTSDYQVHLGYPRHKFVTKRKYLIFKETICTRCGYKLTKEKRN